MKTLVLILSVLFAMPSFALFEARINYGLLQTKPNLDDLYNGASSIPTVPVVYGFGADAIVQVPFLGWGFGMRYENLGFKASSSTLEFKNEVTRTSLIANKRFIDTLVYLGPIFTLGLAHDLSMTVTDNGAQASKFTSNKCFSYSAGLEGGASLIGLMVGAELGYQSMKFTGATDANGTLADRDIDMSGTYAKILIGIGI